MLLKIRRFLTDEEGAVTVDWIVGSAMAVGLSVVAVDKVESGISSLAGSIATAISSKSVSNGDAES